MNKQKQAEQFQELDPKQVEKIGYIALSAIACLIGGFVYWYSFISVHATR